MSLEVEGTAIPEAKCPPRSMLFWRPSRYLVMPIRPLYIRAAWAQLGPHYSPPFLFRLLSAASVIGGENPSVKLLTPILNADLLLNGPYLFNKCEFFVREDLFARMLAMDFAHTELPGHDITIIRASEEKE